MNVKNIIASIFGKSNATEAFGETAYANTVCLLTGILENIQDLTPVIVRCKATYGADRKQYIKNARLLGSSLACQLHSLVTTFASYSTEPITKVAPNTPHDIENWCNVVHEHTVHLFGLCAKHRYDIVANVEAQRTVSALNKLHDVIIEMMNEC
jgi:hypothetical protein